MTSTRNSGDPPSVVIGEELSSCPRCAAGGGFHVAFRRRGRRVEVVPVCPSCGFRFVAGEWSFPTGEPRPHDPSVDQGP